MTANVRDGLCICVAGVAATVAWNLGYPTASSLLWGYVLVVFLMILGRSRV